MHTERRLLLLASLFGLGMDYIVIIFAPTLWWLFVARIISGLFGSSVTVANAYIADISEPEDRAKKLRNDWSGFWLRIRHWPNNWRITWRIRHEGSVHVCRRAFSSQLALWIFLRA